MTLADVDIGAYLAALTPDQAESVRLLRGILFEWDPTLIEQVSVEKWWNGLLVYTTATGISAYALGPAAAGKTTLHMMPYYASAELHAAHGAALKKFLTGKSCIQFQRADELPLDSLRDIFAKGMIYFAASRPKKG